MIRLEGTATATTCLRGGPWWTSVSGPALTARRTWGEGVLAAQPMQVIEERTEVAEEEEDDDDDAWQPCVSACVRVAFPGWRA